MSLAIPALCGALNFHGLPVESMCWIANPVLYYALNYLPGRESNKFCYCNIDIDVSTFRIAWLENLTIYMSRMCGA